MRNALVPVARIERAILFIRGEKVMLDADLAVLYGVSKRLNEQVKRNIRRFPRDFMVRLTEVESRRLRSQIATSNRGRGGRRTRPYAFTEHGAIMLASVLNSDVAIQGSIQVVRAFVRLRRLLASHADLAASSRLWKRSTTTSSRPYSTPFGD
jgi:ORF6N domain